MLRSLAQTGSGPAEVLTRLNNMMIEDFPSGRFVTMVYAELDPCQPHSRIANAGHLSPLLVEPSGYRWINHEHGLPLGISASKFSETEVPLVEHSRIAFYSDGITEAEIEFRRRIRCGAASHPDAITRRYAGGFARGCQEIRQWKGSARRCHRDFGECTPRANIVTKQCRLEYRRLKNQC